jgi:N-methylhydantoinase A
VTDANLVLGRLNPDNFLGGEIGLDVELAKKAIQERCADRLGMPVVEVANAIVEIANAAMVNAVRLVSVQRGFDPREFVLVAFGGAGPAHANRLAAETEMPRVLVPMSPGIFSALGLLVTDLKHEYSATLIRRTEGLDAAEVEQAFAGLEAHGREALGREGVADGQIEMVRAVDMRYVGQSYELTVPLEDGRFTVEVAARFHREHDRAYGYSAPSEPTELVNVRLTALGKIAKPRLREVGVGSGASARQGSRAVYFAETGGFADTPVYDRYGLGAGQVVAGPAVVEELDSTTVIHPGYRATVDRYGNLLVEAGS